MPVIELKSDITGSVWKVLKAAGDNVEEDEPVLIMESMKMEIPVTAPEAGRVKDVLVKEGETVSDGTVVARIEL